MEVLKSSSTEVVVEQDKERFLCVHHMFHSFGMLRDHQPRAPICGVRREAGLVGVSVGNLRDVISGTLRWVSLNSSSYGVKGIQLLNGNKRRSADAGGLSN